MAPGSSATPGLLALGLWATKALPLATLLTASVVYAWVVIASAPAITGHDDGPNQSGLLCVAPRPADHGVSPTVGHTTNERLVVLTNVQSEHPTVFIVESSEDADVWQARIDASDLLATATGAAPVGHRVAILVSSGSEPAFRDGIHLENQVRLEQGLPFLRVVDLRQ